MKSLEAGQVKDRNGKCFKGNFVVVKTDYNLDRVQIRRSALVQSGIWFSRRWVVVQITHRGDMV
jgi:hypothetical protein